MTMPIARTTIAIAWKSMPFRGNKWVAIVYLPHHAIGKTVVVRCKELDAIVEREVRTKNNKNQVIGVVSLPAAWVGKRVVIVVKDAVTKTIEVT